MRVSTPLGASTQLISKRIRKKPPVLILDGAWLKDEKEECFAVLIADGVPLALAFKRAGLEVGPGHSSAMQLFSSQRLRARVSAILEARGKHPPISLSEVTDMLKRVYAGALHDTEYNAAHNAAFSLARLYGLVVDRAQLDVIRRPSREPDAPAEVALSSWIAGLPPYTPGPQGPGPRGQGPGLLIEGSAHGSDIDTTRPGPGAGRVETGNEAPTRPVTWIPTAGGRSSPLGGGHSPHEGKGAPSVADEGTGIPSAEDLF